MKKTMIFLLLMAVPVMMFAQLKVSSVGNVSVGTLNTYSYIDMYSGNGASIFNSYDSNIGVVGTPSVLASTSNIGVEGYLNSNLTANSSDKNYGVLGIVSASTNSHANNYGVYGIINTNQGVGVFGSKSGYSYYYPLNVSGKYAGYFYGEVYSTETVFTPSVCTISDSRLNENVTSMGETDRNGEQTLQKILSMNVVEFNRKNIPQERTDNGNVEIPEEMAGMVEAERAEMEALAAQRHYGLIAQELKDIYPTLVQEGQDGYLSINYTEMVPILIRSIQVLKQELDEVNGINADDKSQSRSIANGVNTAIATGNVLYQNTPNPFKEKTVIRFKLADDAQNAAICIFDLTGKQLKKMPISSGETSVSVNGWELGEGMFLYTLLVNGQEIDTRRMIITK